MSTLPLLLADAETQEILSSLRFMDPSTRNGLVIFGSIALVTLLALVWAAFLRKRGRRRRKHHHSHHHSAPEAAQAQTVATADASPTQPEEGRKRRRRRHHRRVRNPTLAETGGLPPLRPQEPSEPEA